MPEPSDFQISDEERRRLEDAFKDPEFMRLFRDYAEEIQAPEARALYEREIAALERERGNEIKWVHPSPRFAVALARNVYVNFAASDALDAPQRDALALPSASNARWRIPLSATAPRTDILRVPGPGTQAGGAATEVAEVTVYDVVYHPDAFGIPNAQRVLISTGLEALQNHKFAIPSVNDYRIVEGETYIGTIKSTVIREPKQGHVAQSDDVLFKSKVGVAPSLPVPALTVVHLEDAAATLTFGALEGAAARGTSRPPRRLSVRTTLRRVTAASEINVVVSADGKTISINVAGKYALATATLPFPILESSCRAKWRPNVHQISIDATENVHVV